MEASAKTKRGAGGRAAVCITEGSLWRGVMKFSLPLMCAQLLEITFNMSDIVVVGHFASYLALGAVGSTTMLVTMFTGLLIGMGAGLNARVALLLGAKEHKSAFETIHTAFLLCLAAGVIICGFVLVFAGFLLGLLNTKPELIQDAVLYLRIYSLGLPGMALFNWGNAVLSAKGDTRKPLVYLTAAGVLNVLLNLFFVVVCHRAADGVAIASAMAQYLSCFLVVRRLCREQGECRLEFKKLRFYPGAARPVLRLGLPAGIQNAVFAFANLFVQTGVNSFDAVMVSGNAAAMNADGLIFNVMGAFYTACATFMSQNIGAGQKQRVLKSYFVSIFYAFAFALAMGVLLLAFGPQILGLFTSEPAVIEAGMQRVRVMALAYCITAFMDGTVAASRGLGKSVAPTVIILLGSCVFRVIWVYTVFAWVHTIPALYMLYPFSWTITAIAEVAYFARAYRQVVGGKG